MSQANRIFEDLFVLELANNHWGRLDRGLRIVTDFSRIVRFNNVRAAIKLQLRDVDSFIHKDFRGRDDIRYIKKTVDTRLDKQDYVTLVQAIRKSSCIPMATPFDEAAVDLCVELGLDILKLASSDLNDWILIEKIASTKKPVIVSTGGSSLKDVDDLVKFFANRNIPLAINHCVSLYPIGRPRARNQPDRLPARPLSRQRHRLFHPRASRLEQFRDAGLRQGRAHLRAPHRHRG
jgi:sialic acid synthase SpsE